MPALRQDVAHRTRNRLEALARSGLRRVDDVVEHQVPLVERVVAPGEPDRAAAVLLEQLRCPSVRAVYRRPCHSGSYAQPNDFVVEYRATIRRQGERLARRCCTRCCWAWRRTMAGPSSTSSTPTARACSQPSRPFLTTRRLREEIDRCFECLGSDLLIIDHIRLEPKWRGLKLGLLALRQANRPARERLRPGRVSAPPAERRRHAGTAAGGQGEAARATSSSSGFRRIGKTDFYGLSTSHVMPKFEDVLRQSAKDGSTQVRQP